VLPGDADDGRVNDEVLQYLAIADVRMLFECIDSYGATGSPESLDQYSGRALQRIWKAQNFSYWMTSMLHERPDANSFDRQRQLGELSAVVNSPPWVREAYTGWPSA
jgi:p-hydroxybenzoate 3-monooxygenase